VESLIFQFGYLGLFILSYVSATLFPLSAEVAVVGMVAVGYNALLTGLVAVAGSFLGSLTNYFIGKKGTEFVLSHYVKYEPRWLERAEVFFNRWGPIALFFSWLPFIGDPLTLVAGAVNTNLRSFYLWVLLGKVFRMAALIALTLNLFPYTWFQLQPPLCSTVTGGFTRDDRVGIHRP
jgi:membrane protein YqaA with SNARE-associated domain